MPKRSEYRQGTPNWVDLQTTDQSAAKKFYTSLFGWGYDDNPVPGGGGVYSMATLNGEAVAAIAPMPPGAPEGMPPIWNTYIAVDDVDAVVDKVVPGGGQVMMPAFDIGDAGRMSFITDPTGAAVGLWQANRHIGATLVNETGTLIWNELLTDKPDLALAFYEAVVGLTHSSMEIAAGQNYRVLKAGDAEVGGCMEPPMPGVPNHWHVYFAVDDADATAAKAAAAGGQVIAEPADIPSVGRFAVLSDGRPTVTTKLRRARSVLATALVLVAGVILAMRTADAAARTTVVAYFDNSNGVFAGDDVLIRGVPVGKIVKIEPQPLRAKISFWFDRKYRVPADAAAAILSPQLVTGRAIQLTPPYAGGPTMADGTVIPQERTVVPVEWDDLRAQLQRLTALLQPTRPGGVSTLGALINTAADNLRGQGATIRDTIIKLSQAISALGDHSKDIFSTVTNLSTLVTALHDSADLLERLNHNLAAVTSLLADGPDKIGQAAEDLNAVVADVGSFAAEHREAIGTASDKLASITTALVDSLDDIKQTLHISPTVLQNFNNIFEPANGALTGALAGNNMANPIAFLCGAIQAASRLGGEQAAKLCVQYLAPIVKNRQYNYPPLGANLFVGAQARPNEVTYSEDWLRPDYVAPVADTPPDPAAAVTVDPATGLRGMMMPPGGGS